MADLNEINAVKAAADLMFSEAQIGMAFDRMAEAISLTLTDCNPVLICVLTGGIIPNAMLMQRLDFPLTSDTIHASRYQGETTGSDINWISLPQSSLEDRNVLIVDDILDEGLTLEAIRDYCIEHGAASVYSAVLVEKILDRKKPHQADFIGLQAENRYLFGCGMDYKGYWRNLPAIYACKDL